MTQRSRVFVLFRGVIVRLRVKGEDVSYIQICPPIRHCSNKQPSKVFLNLICLDRLSNASSRMPCELVYPWTSTTITTTALSAECTLLHFEFTLEAVLATHYRLIEPHGNSHASSRLMFPPQRSPQSSLGCRR
eukprot:441946-Rhodomonas_salina.1